MGLQVLRRAFKAQAAIVVSSLDLVSTGQGKLAEGHACAVVQLDETNGLRCGPLLLLSLHGIPGVND